MMREREGEGRARSPPLKRNNISCSCARVMLPSDKYAYMFTTKQLIHNHEGLFAKVAKGGTILVLLGNSICCIHHTQRAHVLVL